MDPAFWNQRFGGDDFFYGTEPNDFVAAVAAKIPTGPVLCLGEGEGRNAAFLAGLGHGVTAVDQSPVGLAKAQRLATSRGLLVATVVSDLANFEIPPGTWSAVVATFVHLPPPVRRAVHRRAAAGLRSGGVFVLEAYTPAQVLHRTGGPVNQPELLMTLADLREDFADLEFLVAQEIEREVNESIAHRGRSAVVQILARRN